MKGGDSRAVSVSCGWDAGVELRRRRDDRRRAVADVDMEAVAVVEAEIGAGAEATVERRVAAMAAVWT